MRSIVSYTTRWLANIENCDVPSLHDQIAALFTEKLHIEVPSIDTDLLETGALDSLTFVDLLVQLEQEFGIRLSLEDLEIEDFRPIARIAPFVSHGT